MLHVKKWIPCEDSFLFLVFEECSSDGHRFARYVQVSHLPIHHLKNRTLVLNKDAFYGSRELVLLFSNEQLAQNCYEYVEKLRKL